MEREEGRQKSSQESSMAPERTAMRKKETFFKLMRCQKREKQRDRREVGGVRAVLLSLAEETFFKLRGKDSRGSW